MIVFTLITPSSDFPKTWKKKRILYLSPSRASISVIRGSDDARKVSNESQRGYSLLPIDLNGMKVQIFQMADL